MNIQIFGTKKSEFELPNRQAQEAAREILITPV